MAFTGTTDAAGKVTLVVPAGTYTVDDATVPAGFTKAPAQTGVVVGAGSSVPVTFQVTAATGSLVITVVDQFGRPAVGVVVSAA